MLVASKNIKGSDDYRQGLKAIKDKYSYDNNITLEGSEITFSWSVIGQF